MQHILLVTSQEQLLAPIIAVLKTILGHKSELVAPGDAIPAINNFRPDIIIIDMHQQSQSIELVRCIKKKFAAIPVIAMVPYGDLSMVEQVISQGADDYISQPIALERLKVTLRNMLRLRILLQRAHISQPEILAPSLPADTDQNDPFVCRRGQLQPLRVIEEAAIRNAIEQCRGCMTDAAKALGIGRSTLYRKIQEMRLSMS